MTWHAQSGPLVLEGDEAKLFREAILFMGETIEDAPEDQDSFFAGAQVFDRMSRTQQIASLEVVARYLFYPTPECLPLTAWSEATLASILQVIRDFIQTEIEDGHDDDCRQVILSLLDPVEDLGDLDDAEAWQWVLDAYEDRFLWDRDFEDDQLNDLPPEHAERVRAMMTIDDEYYTAIPPDLPQERDVRQGRKRPTGPRKTKKSQNRIKRPPGRATKTTEKLRTNQVSNHVASFEAPMSGPV